MVMFGISAPGLLYSSAKPVAVQRFAKAQSNSKLGNILGSEAYQWAKRLAPVGAGLGAAYYSTLELFDTPSSVYYYNTKKKESLIERTARQFGSYPGAGPGAYYQAQTLVAPQQAELEREIREKYLSQDLDFYARKQYAQAVIDSQIEEATAKATDDKKASIATPYKVRIID